MSSRPFHRQTIGEQHIPHPAYVRQKRLLRKARIVSDSYPSTPDKVIFTRQFCYTFLVWVSQYASSLGAPIPTYVQEAMDQLHKAANEDPRNVQGGYNPAIYCEIAEYLRFARRLTPERLDAWHFIYLAATHAASAPVDDVVLYVVAVCEQALVAASYRTTVTYPFSHQHINLLTALRERSADILNPVFEDCLLKTQQQRLLSLLHRCSNHPFMYPKQ